MSETTLTRGSSGDGSGENNNTPPEVISIKRENLTVLDGHRRRDAARRAVHENENGGGGGGGGAGGGVDKDRDDDGEMPLESLRERIASDGPIEMIEGEQAVFAKLQEGKAVRSHPTA